MIEKKIESLKDELLTLRRDFHQHPELGFEEHRTAGIVADYLQDCGLKVQEKIAETGVVGLLRGNMPGKTILLRADMDALPVQEENDLCYRSINEGKMHACGHDGHMAMLLVAARVLSEYREELRGNIKFVFQPNEEDAGAARMIEEGVLANPAVDAAFALHLWSPIKTGKIGLTAGPIMASSDYFRLTIKGRSGHGGAPHEAVDPILCASNIIQNVQSIQSRNMDALREPTVITFGSIEGGSFPIIIPEKVLLQGSIRCLHGRRGAVIQRFKNIIEHQCRAVGTDHELKIECGNNLLSNDPDMVRLAKDTARKILNSEDNILSDIRVMLGDDFSEFALKVPAVYCFLGTGNRNKGTDYPHHHPQFNIDEDSLFLGVEMHVRTALRYLN